MKASLEHIGNALGGKMKPGGGWMCHCPAHDDTNPSLSVDLGVGMAGGPGHPYLGGKCLVGGSLRHGGNLLLVPMRDPAGMVQSIQTIDPADYKLFAKGARVSGLHFLLGEAVRQVEVVVHPRETVGPCADRNQALRQRKPGADHWRGAVGGHQGSVRDQRGGPDQHG